jgi:Ala-tRNA(Pro) deacylase
MPVKKLKEYLENQGVKYVTINHVMAYTAQQIASTTHIKGKELAKTVMVKIDGKMAMVVLPASFKVDLELVKSMFPECDPGAMPPFGNLYGMDVYMEEKLVEDEEIAFNAGSHLELIKMAYKDFARLVKPRIGRFTTSRVPAF